jgi:hypothetical protein
LVRAVPGTAPAGGSSAVTVIFWLLGVALP